MTGENSVHGTTYVATSVLKAFHAIPRFGHSSNIAEIFNPSDGSIDVANLKDYALGLAFIPGTCIAALLLWLLVLLFSKCLGQRCGICAGYSLQEKYDSSYKSKISKHYMVRGFLLTYSSLVAICGLLFFIKGSSSIENVLNDFRDGANGIGYVVDNLLNSTDSLVALGTTSTQLKENFQTLIQGGLCTTGSVPELDDYSQLVVDSLTFFEDFSNTDLVDLKQVLSDEVSSIDSRIENFADKGAKYAKAEYVAVPILVFGILLTTGQLLAWSGSNVKAYFCFQTWFLLPLFGILVLLACIIISALGTLLTVNSDFCLGGETRSPEGTLKIIASYFDFSATSKEALDFYFLNSCEGTFSQLSEVTGLNGQVAEYQPLLSIFTEALKNETISTSCGLNQETVDQLTGSLYNISDAFAEVLTVTENTVSALQCSIINGIFVDFVHDATCDSTPDAFLWLFSSCAGVFVLGMSIILFRGGMTPSEYTFVDDYWKKDNNKFDDDLPCYDVEDDSIAGKSMNVDNYRDHPRAKVY